MIFVSDAGIWNVTQIEGRLGRLGERAEQLAGVALITLACVLLAERLTS